MSWKRPSLLALFIASMACWLERQAASQIEYLKAENRALRSRLGRRRILFSNAERRTLGRRKSLLELDPIVCPPALASGVRGADMDVPRSSRNHQGLGIALIVPMPV